MSWGIFGSSAPCGAFLNSWCAIIQCQNSILMLSIQEVVSLKIFCSSLGRVFVLEEPRHEKSWHSLTRKKPKKSSAVGFWTTLGSPFGTGGGQNFEFWSFPSLDFCPKKIGISNGLLKSSQKHWIYIYISWIHEGLLRDHCVFPLFFNV